MDKPEKGGRGFGVLAQTIGRTSIPFLRRYVVSAAKNVGADLIEMASPEIENVSAGKKKLKSVAADDGKKTLREQIGARNTSKRRIIRRAPPKFTRLVVEQTKIYFHLFVHVKNLKTFASLLKNLKNFC